MRTKSKEKLPGRIKKFLWPSKWKIILLLAFLLIVYFGEVQTWGFCRECGPKPFLYDFANLIPLWLFPFWIIATLLEIPIIWTGMFEILVLPYCYFLSCLVFWIFRKLIKKKIRG